MPGYLPKTSSNVSTTRQQRSRRSPRLKTEDVKNEAVIEAALEVAVEGASDPFKICLICGGNIKINPEPSRQMGDVKFHYTNCYWTEGKFSFLFSEEDLKMDEKVKAFECPHKECTKRKLTSKMFAAHMGLAHRHTLDIMARDKRKGFRELFTKLFPDEEYLADSKVKVKEEKQLESSDSSEPSEEPNPKKRRLENAEPSYGIKSEPSLKLEACVSVEEVEDISPKEELNQEAVNCVEEKASEDDFDSESVDDPGSGDVQDAAVVRPRVNISHYREDLKEKFTPPRVDKVHHCLLCNGYSNNNKNGRNMNFGQGLHDLKYHYAICFYVRHKFKDFIDAGENNRDESGNLIEDAGVRFKYKCPFENCTKNTGRGSKKLMGFKEYAIHCAVNHHILETVLQSSDIEGMEEVRAALVLARRKNRMEYVPLPEVQCEEIHVCLLCKGEGRDGKHLSFDKNKIASLKYHYACCYYDTGVYKRIYPPGDSNQDENGDPIDVKGMSIKYQCNVRGCRDRAKRRMGYKEYCIHMSSEHNGLLKVMKEDQRPELREIGRRLAKFFDN